MNMSLTRRSFLRASLLGGGSAALIGSFGRVLSGTALAQSASPGAPKYKALVCVFLYGGNDSNNMLIPSDESYTYYQQIRGPNASPPSSDFFIPQDQLLPALTGSNPYPGFNPPTVGGQPNTNWYGLNNQMPMLASLLPVTGGGGPLAFVCNVGTASFPQAQLMTATATDQSMWPVNLYSHLDQQREWQTSQANPSPTSPPNYGWGGVVGQFLAPLVGGTVPVVISTDEGAIFTMPDTQLPNGSLPYVTLGGTIPVPVPGAAQNAQIIFTEGSELMTSMNGIISLAAANGQVVATAVAAGTPGGADGGACDGGAGGSPRLVGAPASWVCNGYPDDPSGSTIFDQLNLVAETIAGRAAAGGALPVREIFFVGFGLFDSHKNQAHEQGGWYTPLGSQQGSATPPPGSDVTGNLLAQLDGALFAFYTAMKNLGLGSQVTTFTMSDFSRTFASASGDGTDHAWGSHQIVLGDDVLGGVLYGQDPSQLLSTYVNGQTNGTNVYDAGAVDSTPIWSSGEGRWIPALSVCQYGYTLAHWLVSGLSGADLMTQIQPVAFSALSGTNSAGKLWFPKSTWDIGFLG
jgi:uncharacterized protein (DUF1501 family)